MMTSIMPCRFYKLSDNCSVPFGGMKASGVGREGGDEALRFFTEPKNICIAK
jgi:aminomuconate-semialdehyde/2-hydroxymuconate-6-semialdehyde dehydrogenase